MTNEKTFKPFGGYLPLFLILATIGASVYLIIDFQYLFMIAAIILSVFCLPGFFVINPNEAMVMVFFGTYKGTVKSNGFFWANPFFSKKKVSLKARNFDSEPIKVNDKTGNPIMIGVVLVWRVENTYKAAFEVDHYEHFVTVQSESALRNLAGSYSYDNF
ncbi:MAG: SPFH domain-containing protein, partial [Bacteroidetes bacterium]|nr:SPFH domain-containing protein [Bacteroidota bacterium]